MVRVLERRRRAAHAISIDRWISRQLDAGYGRGMSKQTLILTIRTKPGRRDDFRAAWDRHLRTRVEASTAQELYLFCEDADDPDVVRIVEVYNDLGAMAENARAPWFAAYMQEAGPYLDGQPSMARAEPVWAKGLAL